MQGLAVVVVIILAVASRPIEARLWRAGRLSDRTTAILLLARFPVLCFLLAVIGGASLPFVIGITALTSIAPALFYGFMLRLLREQKQL
jgi:hypothetical protein